MSYILDALRKSDAQRRRGATPELLTPQAAAVASGPPRTWSYGLLAAVLVGAGILIGSLRPWQTEPPASSATTGAVRPFESGPSPSASAPLPEAREMVRKSEGAAPVQKSPHVAQFTTPPAAATMKRQTPARAKAGTQSQARSHPTVAPKPKVVSTSAINRPHDARPGDAAQEEKVVAFSDLPVSIQQEIPKLAISVHAYSPVAKERLVGINDRVLREGEPIAPGLKLEQITLDGMIISYKGYRFRRGVR